jgi:hypothetical protein
MTLSKSLKRARLSVPVYRLGVSCIGGQRIAVIQFGVPAHISKSEISRNAVEMIFSAYGTGTDIDRLDLYGTDKPDVKGKKGRKGLVLFSISAKKEDFHKVDYSLPSAEALKVFGLTFYSETITDTPKSWVKSIKRQYYLFRLEKLFKKMQNIKMRKLKKAKKNNKSRR